MNIDILKERYRKLIRQIYSPELYYQRVKILLQEYHRQKIKPHINFDMIWRNSIALIRSTFQLGIFGKERKQYWKLFFWTLFNKPELLALAITYSIYGYHFRMVSELHVTE